MNIDRYRIEKKKELLLLGAHYYYTNKYLQLPE